MIRRCDWCEGSDAYRAYHDSEWGVPLHDDRQLFEFLTLEGAQAGLSWSTILHKREGYRRLYEGFQPERVAAFERADIERLLQDPAIVRHRLKIEASVTNARAFLELQARYGSFDRYIWDFVDGTPQQNRWRSLADVPAQTPTAQAMSKALKKAGFRFVGPTICYAFMQATGMVNDHLHDCFRHPEVAALAPG
ncbi:DNA-3-methyladenine glycosylase I [Motiliproteus sediminis]|uniref:DNA-3-methyladenine glycosylase I n=1 Tax=Motiliproteus sediminis TaxID=1468178 RepID=UPI001AEF53EA|nr:DNA-3-methyladenine glycosylase I [Motiliproteus sediminis]